MMRHRVALALILPLISSGCVAVFGLQAGELDPDGGLSDAAENDTAVPTDTHLSDVADAIDSSTKDTFDSASVDSGAEDTSSPTDTNPAVDTTPATDTSVPDTATPFDTGTGIDTRPADTGVMDTGIRDTYVPWGDGSD